MTQPQARKTETKVNDGTPHLERKPGLHLSDTDKKILRVGLRERMRIRKRKEDLRRKALDWRHEV